MKFISLNINGSGKERYPLLIEYLICHNPDFIILSEFKNNETGKKICKELENSGFNLHKSYNDERGVLIASKEEFSHDTFEERWAEISLKKNNLKVLGVYFPTPNYGKEAKSFWDKVLKYAKINKESNIIILGDFNSCALEDTEGQKAYYPKELKRLSSMGWIDVWKKYNTDDSNKYTFYDNASKMGLRLDYAFISPSTETNLKKIKVVHDPTLTKTLNKGKRITDHSAVIVELEFK